MIYHDVFNTRNIENGLRCNNEFSSKGNLQLTGTLYIKQKKASKQTMVLSPHSQIPHLGLITIGASKRWGKGGRRNYS